MNLLGISALVNCIACAGLAAFVMHKGVRANRSTSVAYVLFNLSVALYNLFYFLWQSSLSIDRALVWFHLLFLLIIWINQAYLFFIFTFLDQIKEKRNFLFVCAGVNSIFSILNFLGILYPTLEPRFNLGFWPRPTFAFTVYLAFWVFQCSYGFIELLKSYTKTSGTRKEQLKYLIFAFSIGFFGGATNWPVWFSIYCPPYFNALIAVYDAVIAYAILRHRLMDISLIIRKTIIYSAVTGTLTGIYLVIIAIFAHLFEGLAGYQTIFSSAIAAALITVCFQPLRKRVQAFVDSKFFREYVDREEKLYELSREVITHTTPEAMAESLIRVLGDTLHPKSTALYLQARDGSGFVLVSQQDGAKLPTLMDDNNPLAKYFSDHPQPFVQPDSVAELGETLDTRRPSRKEDAA